MKKIVADTNKSDSAFEGIILDISMPKTKEIPVETKSGWVYYFSQCVDDVKISKGNEIKFKIEDIIEKLNMKISVL